ncbi:MAG: hypothetical protein NC218_02215 [Acetobacter sp.]|nr:hypothetical protein [Acetobacter sp.]
MNENLKGESFYDGDTKKMRYFDKNGKEILEGTTIRHDNGETELIYACGDGDLGVNASTKKYIEENGESARECYPLTQFDLHEWEIVK